MKIVGIAKIFISFVLVIVYFILFGLESLQRLQDGDITLTRNDEFLENITSPGRKSEKKLSLTLLIILKLSFDVLVICIEQIGKSFGTTEKHCSAMSTMDKFKECVDNSRKMITLGEHFTTDMDMLSIYHMVEPKDGVIGFHDSDKLILLLEPNNQYYVTFYDRNFLLRSDNPEIVPKNGITIDEKALAFIYLKVKVKGFFIFYFYDLSLKAIRHQKMNTERNPCETDVHYSYQDCVKQKFISNLQCKPYWLKNIYHDRICENVSEMSPYFIELQKLKNMDDETIFETYKCRKPCTFMEYKV